MAWSVAVSGGTPFAGQKTATHKFALGQALQFSPALGEDNCKGFATRLFYSSPKPATFCNTGSRARWTGTSASSAKTSSAAHDKRGESHWPKVKVEATVKPRSPNPPRRNRLLRHQQSRHLRPGIGWDGRRSHDGEIRTTTAAHKRAAQSAPCRLAFRNAGSSPIPPNLAPATHFADQAATAPRRHHGAHRLLPGQKRR